MTVVKKKSWEICVRQVIRMSDVPVQCKSLANLNDSWEMISAE